MRRTLVAAAVALLAPGCGGDIQRGKLHGTVKYQGKPVTSGTVIFLGSDNMSYPADLDKEGKYSVDRIPFGVVKVAIQQTAARPAPKADPTVAKSKGLEGKDASRPAPPTDEPRIAGVAVPAQYNQAETSGLTFEMKAAGQEWSVDLK